MREKWFMSSKNKIQIQTSTKNKKNIKKTEYIAKRQRVKIKK